MAEQLRIERYCFGAGLIPGLGTSAHCGHGQKKKKKKNREAKEHFQDLLGKIHVPSSNEELPPC